MSTYTAPLKDMQFVLTELAGIDKVAALPGYEEAAADVVEAILEVPPSSRGASWRRSTTAAIRRARGGPTSR